MSGRLVAAIRMTPCALAEAVHLDQQLVEGLLALVVAAAQAGAALAADRVDLVDEDDARAVLLGLLEQVAHPGGADADEHLDEVRAGDGEERHAGLAGHRAGQQRLAGSGRAVEQHALGDLGAQRLVAGRVLQEVLDLVELFDRLVDAGDVGERGLGHVLVQQLGPGLAEAEAHPAAALHPGEHHEQADQQQQRQHVDQQLAQDAALVDHGVGLRVLGGQRVEQLDRVPGRVLGDDLGRSSRCRCCRFFRVSRSCCSRSSICALLTLSPLICATATEVSTGLKPRVSSLK